MNYSIVELPIEILYDMVNMYLIELKDQLNFMAMCKKVTNITINYLNHPLINDKVLLQRKFLNITHLDIDTKKSFWALSEDSINHLTNLTLLDYSNSHIHFNISNLTKLVKLTVNVVTFFPLNKLTGLTDLNLFENQNISDIGPLTNLKYLTMPFLPMKMISISHLTNLISLNTNYTKKFPSINNLTNLTILCARETEINQNSIEPLTNLTKLDISGCKNITCITHLINLTKLDISDCKNITCITHLTNLTNLKIRGFSCGIDQAQIMNLYSLRSIKTANNDKILSTSHLTNLEK